MTLFRYFRCSSASPILEATFVVSRSASAAAAPAGAGPALSAARQVPRGGFDDGALVDGLGKGVAARSGHAIAAGHGDRLPDGKARPVGLRARIGNVAADEDRPVFGDRQGDLLRKDHVAHGPGAVSDDAHLLAGDQLADLGPDLGEETPPDIHFADDRKGRRPVEFDRDALPEGRHARGGNLEHVAGFEAILGVRHEGRQRQYHGSEDDRQGSTPRRADL
jgi:hypothetical protein